MFDISFNNHINSFAQWLLTPATVSLAADEAHAMMARAHATRDTRAAIAKLISIGAQASIVKMVALVMRIRKIVVNEFIISPARGVILCKALLTYIERFSSPLVIFYVFFEGLRKYFKE